MDDHELSAPGQSNSSRKRKQLDEDEVLLKDERLREQQIENEYENLDDDVVGEEEEEDEDEETANKKKAEFERILRAQEPATITQYDDIKITPFNLEEELEEGDFDKAGNFVFRKESSPNDEYNNDTWAESIDWSAVERRAKEEEQKRKNKQSTTSEPSKGVEGDQPEPIRDRLTCYRQMLRIMRPDEAVQKTIRRLGDNVPKRRPNKLKSKSQSSQPDTNYDAVNVAEARKKLDLMIELAHQRLEDGETDIYQKSYEDLEEAINL